MIRVFALVLLFTAPVFAQQYMYVRSPSARLMESTAATGRHLKDLPRGTKVQVFSKDARWAKVSASGVTGYVYLFYLGADAPRSSSGSLAGLGGGGASANEASTASSMRGLSPTSEKYAGRTKISKDHIQMVKHMESVKVTQAEIDSFLKDGKLGEYGGAP